MFIDLYQRQPNLYNINIREYHNRDKETEFLICITMALGEGSNSNNNNKQRENTQLTVKIPAW